MIDDAQSFQQHLVSAGAHPDLVTAIVQGIQATPGLTFATVIQLILTYGLPIVYAIAKVLGWQLPPIPLPTPPPLPTPAATKG